MLKILNKHADNLLQNHIIKEFSFNITRFVYYIKVKKISLFYYFKVESQFPLLIQCLKSEFLLA